MPRWAGYKSKTMVDFEWVEARGLTKLYGATRALLDLDLTLRAGEITSIEGHNGSGKTTLLSLLALLSRPTKGDLLYGAHGVGEAARVRGRIGIVAHAALLYPELSALENLELVAGLYGLADARAAILAMQDRMALGRWATRPTRTYSRGQVQRAALARALLPAPRLLLLDEPSTGLDVHATDLLCEAVLAERARGAIVVLVTHDLALSERLSDRRVTLSRGRVLGGVASGVAAQGYP